MAAEVPCGLCVLMFVVSVMSVMSTMSVMLYRMLTHDVDIVSKVSNHR